MRCPYCFVLVDVAARVWDLYFCDGVGALFQVANGLLEVLSPRLLCLEFDGCMSLLTHQVTDVTEENLFRHVEKIKVSRSALPKDYQTFSFQAPLL